MKTARRQLHRAERTDHDEESPTSEHKPLPFDKNQPFHNLGIRKIDGDSARHLISVTDVELTSRELTGTEGVEQILEQGESF